MSDKMTWAERAFEILADIMEDKQREECPWEGYSDGQELCPERAKMGPCTSGCTFRMFSKKRKLNNVYYCATHARVHLCGRKCQRKIINHEMWSCPFTGEVIEECIFAEDVSTFRSSLSLK